VRVVRDHVPLSATLEDDAPVNAGETVDFMASAVKVSRPEESDGAGAAEVTLTIDNISGEISNALRAARGSLDTWEVTERIYASDDTTGPASLPVLTLTLTGVRTTPESAVFKASFGDPVNVSVPRLTFKRNEYPGLSAR
jgi:hypothetical protein